MGTEFHYIYSAPTEEERKEIVSIRKQYEERAPQSQSKLDRLRKLDARVKNSALALALTVGIIGCLIFGLGMAMVLEWGIFIGGIIISIAGAGGMVAAKPLHAWCLHKNKRRYGEEILRLSEELLQK